MRSKVWSRTAALLLAVAFVVPVVSAFRRTVDAAVSAGSVTLAIPGRANATPSIAADDDVVAVAWGASLPSGATDVFLAVSRDGARTFGAPTRVNDADGDARLNGEQPPRVTLRNNVITVVWTTKGTSGTKLLQSRSSDGGRSFAKAATVAGSDAAGNRGWENAATDRDGRTFAVWLDHRALAQDSTMAASHHDHSGKKPDGIAMAQKSKLYIASLDGAVAPTAVTSGVCYCCKTAIAAGADGSLYAAWRHVYPGNIRDIAFTMSRDGGRTFAAPVRVSEDRWVLEGCPDDGPAMAIGADNRIHIVWPTLITEDRTAERAERRDSSLRSPRAPRLNVGQQTIALFYATSNDGARFTARERIPTQGMPHHPQIAVGADDLPVIVWDEGADGGRRVAMTRMSPRAGPTRFSREALAETAVYPVVAAVRGATVAAWTSGQSPASVIRVERKS
jgi:hypothetical protein